MSRYTYNDKVSNILHSGAMTQGGENIKAARRQAGLTQQQLARRVGVSRVAVSQWESGATWPATSKLTRMAAVLGVGVDRLLGLSGSPGSEAEVAAGSALRAASLGPLAPVLGNKDLPVIGLGVCGQDGWTGMNGAVNEHIARPGNLGGVGGAYALYVFGTSMEPQFSEGQIIHVHPHRPITAGCPVVVGLADHSGLIKRFARRDQKKWVFEQLNPKRQLILPATEVASVHRIVGWSES